MNVKQIFENLGLKIHNEADTAKEVKGVYAGDLLSWVMGHANEGKIHVTIMSNMNVLAVASLLELSLVILSEGVVPDREFIETASAKGINVATSELTTYEVCAKLAQML